MHENYKYFRETFKLYSNGLLVRTYIVCKKRFSCGQVAVGSPHSLDRASTLRTHNAESEAQT